MILSLTLFHGLGLVTGTVDVQPSTVLCVSAQSGCGPQRHQV